MRRPFGSADRVLKYLARYTHRVAISNARVIDMKDGKARFRYKDDADGGKQKVMQLDATEFIRRFLLHVLPRGFMKIRHYGFLANRFRKEKLALCRQLLGVDDTTEIPEIDPSQIEHSPLPSDDSRTIGRCPKCGQGKMVMIEQIPAEKPNEATPEIVTCAADPISCVKIEPRTAKNKGSIWGLARMVCAHLKHEARSLARADI